MKLQKRTITLGREDTRRWENSGPSGDAFRREVRAFAREAANRLGKSVEIHASKSDGGWVAAIVEPQGRAGGRASGKREKMVATYTTAPEAYDYTGFGAVSLGVVGHTDRGKPIRKVMNPEAGVDHQRGRYASGMNMAADETEWKKLVSYKLVTKVGAASGMAAGRGGKVYIVYVDGVERGMIRATGHNAAEKKAQALYPGRQVSVAYTEI